MFPRLDPETFLPLCPEEWGDQIWYPPGHGDFYNCIEQQGILRSLIEDGKDILFISNADNLGAVADSKILNYMIEKESGFSLVEAVVALVILSSSGIALATWFSLSMENLVRLEERQKSQLVLEE